MSDQREQLRATFDAVALLYDEVRPGYPEALFDDLVALAGLADGARILEIGCGTGQATLPLARRGFAVRCVELGANLADVARHKLDRFPHVEVVTGAFETWPLEPAAYDLVLAATSFHWIDPAARYVKSAQALRPGGALAVIGTNHVQSAASQDFFEAAQQVYERETPELTEDSERLLWPDEVATPLLDEIAQSGLFGLPVLRRYVWEQDYDAASYLRLLDTYSGHRALSDERRAALFQGIAALIDGPYGGRITKGYLTTLYVARVNSKR